MKSIKVLYLFWGAALVVLGAILFVNHSETTSFYGIAETREIMVNTEAPVEIKRLRVVAGQEIQKGDLLVEFERPELAMQINKITHELEELKTRNDITFAEISSRIEQLNAQKALKVSEIDGRIKQLQAQYDINKEMTTKLGSIQHSVTAESREGPGSPLKIRIESLKRELELTLSELEIQIDQLNKELEAPESPIKIRIERLERELNLLLAERNKLYIFAPVTGIIGSVNVKEGEKASPFVPVVTLHTKCPSYVKGFIHENVHNRISIGSQAEIIPLADRSKRVTGMVMGVGSRIVEFPVRLRRRPDVQVWGREVLIKIPEDNNLLLGEKVMIKSSQTLQESYWTMLRESLSLKNTLATGVGVVRPQGGEAPIISTISIDTLVKGVTNIEASGIVYLEDIKKYVIISDSTDDRRAVLYLMNDEGRIEEEVAIQGIKRLDDMEAIAADTAGNLYIACSQSREKDGTVPQERRLLVRVQRDRSVFGLDKKIVLYDALQQAARTNRESAWAEFLFTKQGVLSIEIEGMVYHEGNLLLGLKRPLREGKAVIVQIEDIDEAFEQESLSGKAITMWKTFDLKDPATGVPTGISDLCLADNKLFILSCATVKGKNDKKRLGNLWVYNLQDDTVTLLQGLSDVKPEGIAYNADEQAFIITLDCGGKASSQIMKLKKL